MKLINLITLVSSIYRVFGNVNENASIEDLLEMGDISVGKDDPQSAIEYYEKGIEKMNENDSLLTALSLYTNLGKTYVSVENKPKAVIMYRKAIMLHSKNIDKIVAKSFKKEATDLAAQASFFLGTVLEGFEMFDEASDAYFYANSLDKNHWASLANRGSILLNHLKKTAEALGAYYNAFDILAHKDGKATDAPENLEEVLSQLQYKIGSAIIFSGTKTCTTLKDATKEIPCSDIAADAFNYAIELDPNNEQAKHMVASVTSDETMERASITYVTKLFEEYAGNFERSLVEGLGYDGYERLRRAFDTFFGGADKVPSFKLTVDAGCGTGLVGEQFRNVTEYLVGTDLSPLIIKEALETRPALYNETKVGDMTGIFQEKKPIDLIIAADSYIYMGDLNPLFKAMNEGLNDGGFVAFTLENPPKENEEKLKTTKADWKWQLQPYGRFAHNKDYVTSVGNDYALQTVHYEEMNGFRRQGKHYVRGHIFIMQKQLNDEL